MMRRLLVALTATGALAFSACSAQEASVVKTAFEQDIESADVTVALSVQSSKGGDSGLTLSGPFRSAGKDKLPSFDWKLRIDGMRPQPVEGRVISSRDDAFVEYGGETYQVGKDKIAQLGAMGGGGMESADLAGLMGKMQDWFPESDAQSDAELGGEPVTRVTGKLDLSAALEDMKELAEQPGASGFEGLKQLSDGDLAQVERLISDPTFTVDIGRSDDKLRRVEARMTIKDGSGEKGTISFSIRLANVDKPVTITPPASGRPIEELMRKLQQDFGATVPEETTIS